jgi:hypothetical protein
LESTLGCAFQAKQEVFGFARAADPLFFFQPTSQLLLLLYIPPSPSRFFFFSFLFLAVRRCIPFPPNSPASHASDNTLIEISLPTSGIFFFFFFFLSYFCCCCC